MPQNVSGTVTAQGFAALAGAVTQSQSLPVFAGVRINDESGNEIETLTADHTVEPSSSPLGTTVNSVATFSSAQVTAPVHSAALVDITGAALVTANFSPPFPAAEALSITMANFFTEETT